MSNERITTVVSIQVSRDGTQWSADGTQLAAAFRDISDGIPIYVRKIQQDAMPIAGSTTQTYAPVGMTYPSEPLSVVVINKATK